MAHPLLRGFGRKNPGQGSADGAASGAPVAAAPEPAAPGEPAALVQARAALDLARELLRGAEHFVLSTPDLDAPGFLARLRATAARLTPAAPLAELEEYRKWAADSLAAFGQLQRRYLSEREDELWRLLTLYQEHQKIDGAANDQFHDALRGTHDRLGKLMALDDLRQVRERLECELARVGRLVDQKEAADEERAAMLAAQVQQLEADLVRARHEAMRDSLTGVYHRGGFQSQLETALRAPQRCALALIDVDNFKDINDTLGHLVGDQVLQVAVQVLGKATRPGEVIGRYGGDEFCILAPATSPERLAERIETLASARNVTFQQDDRHCSVRLSFSVGIAGSIPGETAAGIMERADRALYEVKRNGKGHVRVAPPAQTCAV